MNGFQRHCACLGAMIFLDAFGWIHVGVFEKAARQFRLAESYLDNALK